MTQLTYTTGSTPLTWTAQPSHHDPFTNSRRVPPRHARMWLAQVYAGHGAGGPPAPRPPVCPTPGNGHVILRMLKQNPLMIVTCPLPHSPSLSHSPVIPSPREPHMCHRVLPCALLACPGMCLLSLTSAPSLFPSPQPSTLPTTHLPHLLMCAVLKAQRNRLLFMSTVWVSQEHQRPEPILLEAESRSPSHS